jgi:membrane-bound lytic murein transglycosylase MltF
MAPGSANRARASQHMQARRNGLKKTGYFPLLVALLIQMLCGFHPASAAPPVDLPVAQEQWTGDLAGMRKRGVIRALVVYSMTNYFLDGGTQRGFTYELLKEFHQQLAKTRAPKDPPLKLLIIPVRRDQLLPWLTAGRGDIAAANLTVTAQRQKQVDFSQPFASGIREVVVASAATTQPAGLDDLARREIHVRRSSSYYQSLEKLNRSLRQRGLQPVRIVAADEHLEDEDLLEMVNAGLIPMTIVDDHKAGLWEEVFDNIRVHRDLAVRDGGEIAWAVRKNSPQLAQKINAFASDHKRGTLLGNILFKRYLRQNPWVKNNLAEQELEKLRPMIALFQKYGGKYGLDWRLLAAQGYQESGLDQSKRSAAGAVGVMQIRPATAADKNVGITGVDKLENNIHAASKYLRFIHDRYFADQDMEELDKLLFTLAAYNAGPARVTRLREGARNAGHSPNTWFGHVEIEASRQIGRETVQYVGNVYKYYVAYRSLAEHRQRRDGVIEKHR